MYKNCCKKCRSTSLHTEVKGNNTGLYCDDCGAWQRWLGKDELRAFEYSMREATKEEKDSVNRYVESISKSTGVNFYDKEDDVAKIIYDNLNYMYCDNCRCNSEIEKNSYEYGSTIATENIMVGEFLCKQVSVLQKRFLRVLENKYV